MEGAELAGKILSTWLTLVLGLILLPSAFGVSLGISEIYMKILVKTLEVSVWGMWRPDAAEGFRERDPGAELLRAELVRGGRLGRSAGPRGARLSPAVARRPTASGLLPQSGGPGLRPAVLLAGRRAPSSINHGFITSIG